MNLGLILALIGAQGDGSPKSLRLASTLSEAAMATPISRHEELVDLGDPLCAEIVKNLFYTDSSFELQQPSEASARSRMLLPVEGPSVLLPTLRSAPEELRPSLRSSDSEAEAWFRFFVTESRIPLRFLVGDPTGGHSYSDISHQEKVLNSTIPYRQVRVVRSMLLRFIHIWDDFVDMIENKHRLLVDLDATPVELMARHEERIAEVWRKLEGHIQHRLNGVAFDSEPMLFGIRRTAFASLMFSKDVSGRHFLRATYKNYLLNRLPRNSRIRNFIAGLNDTYVAYTAKVLLEAFDGPFVDMYPKEVRRNFTGLSYLMELLYVPALVKQNESQEMLSGEIARRARLDDQTAGETLLLIMNRIKQLPIDQRAFVVRNLPMFIEKYEIILKKKRIRNGRSKESLFQIYSNFAASPEIASLVSEEKLYRRSLFYHRERSRALAH